MDANRNRKNEFSPAVLALIALFFIFPPLAIVGAIILAYSQAKKNGQVNENALKAVLEGSKRSGMTAGEKFLRHLKEENVAEQPYQSKPHAHAHTPVTYSYDSCAREKRLEQLRVLKDAGLLDEMEYSQRKQDILNVR